MEEAEGLDRKILWAPWREAYILGDKEEDCVFCFQPVEDDRRLVLWRDKEIFAFLNLYPYTNGHLLIAPTRHVADPWELTESESLGIMNGVRKGIKVLREAYDPAGFNVGMNLGKAAGAGVEQHLHVHIVPRWHGDTNFMTVLGDARVLCQELGRTHEILRSISDDLALAES